MSCLKKTQQTRMEDIALTSLSRAEVTGQGLGKLAEKQFTASVPFMRFLCEALDAPY